MGVPTSVACAFELRKQRVAGTAKSTKREGREKNPKICWKRWKKLGVGSDMSISDLFDARSSSCSHKKLELSVTVEVLLGPGAL